MLYTAKALALQDGDGNCTLGGMVSLSPMFHQG